MSDSVASSYEPSRGVPACYRGLRVLVTGATGFIGSWVWRLLDAAGAEVWAVGRSEAALRDTIGGAAPSGGVVEADLARPGAFARVHAQVRPAVTFHLAGYGVDRTERDAELAFRINAELVEEVARVTAGTQPDDGWFGMRLVHTGSAFEYGSVTGPVTEETAPAPRSVYGSTKLEGTRRLTTLAERGEVAAVTARICNAYGPGERETRLLPVLVAAAHTGQTVRLTAGEQERDFVFVRDVAEALLRLGALQPGTVHLVNLGTGRSSTVRQFAETAAAVLGLPPARLAFGAIPYRDDEVWQGPVRVDRLSRVLGWVPPTTIAEGIRWSYSLSCAEEVGSR